MGLRSLENTLRKADILNKIDVSIVESILKERLNIKRKHVLIICDKGIEDRNVAAALAYAYYKACKRLRLKTTLVIQKPKKRGDKASLRTRMQLKRFRR